uniref:CBM20 domain-containing protein n=1 Tax=Takifugu rubripes TaxID=31033 RepID=A0A674NQ62_TAKRU
MREDAGCDVDDEEAALRSAEVSDAGSSLPWQRQDKTSQCVDEVSESSVNGLERPSPETGNPPEPHGATSCETSHLPPTRELGSAPDAAASATFPDPGVAPGPPVGDLQLSSFEPTQKKDDGNASSAGAGAESGISSLAVSPDAEADGNIFSPEPPLMAGDPQAISLYADDAALSAAIERMSGETLGPLQPCCSQMSHSTSWTVANEDAFGHEIEDGYHRLVEQFAAQIAVSVTSLTDQLTDVRAALEVSPHQTVAVTGDQPELGSWKEFLPLEKVKEGDWSAVVGLPTESHVEWKFVLLDKGEVCRWEECGNRLLHTGVGDDVVVHKWWGLV